MRGETLSHHSTAVRAYGSCQATKKPSWKIAQWDHASLLRPKKCFLAELRIAGTHDAVGGGPTKCFRYQRGAVVIDRSYNYVTAVGDALRTGARRSRQR